MFDLMLDPHILRVSLAIGMLVIASTLDVWKREVHDFLWIGFGAIAAVLVLFEADVLGSLLYIGMSLVIVPLALIVWRIGIFGGADAFALIVLAALAPQMTLSENMVTPFTILTNAAIFSVTPIFANFIRNVIYLTYHKNIFEGFEETRPRKILAMFLGYRASNPKYCFSIEKKEGSSKKLHFAIHHAENTEFCNTQDTWVTPGIPYMLYITAGFVAQLFFGDIFLAATGIFLNH